MKKIHPLAAALILAALTMSGCASGASATEAAPTTATATPTPTPTPKPTATTAQFASILAEQETSWREYEEDILDCAMAAIGTAPIDNVKMMSCSYAVQTVTITAQTAAKDIRKLPAAPAEVSKLVERTLLALDTLAKNNARNSCTDPRSETCDAAITKANGDIRPLVSVLDAWKPYL